jgi:nucleotide-binding universal stress UspA family protein
MSNDASPKMTHARRTFLVVVDNSEEMRAALHFACMRARNTGGIVALLRIVEPPEFQHFAAVGKRMADEARTEAEQVMQTLAAEVNRCAGHYPILFVREGQKADELVRLIEEEPSISILVLAAGPKQDDPGPLVAGLSSGKLSSRIRIPVTIVPGTLTDEEIDALA